MPRAAYARAFEANDKRPGLRSSIRGLGVGSSNTALALTQLSPEINFAFLHLHRICRRYRQVAWPPRNHARVPMEPSIFPTAIRSPCAAAAASSEENVKRLTGRSPVHRLCRRDESLGGRSWREGHRTHPRRGVERGLLFFTMRELELGGDHRRAHVKAPIATAR